MKAKRFNSGCLGLQTRRADRILTQFYDSFINKAGLKSTQYGLLRCINSFEAPCLADIGCAMCMDQTTVSRNISKLKVRGYIATAPSKTDPRKTDIKITTCGFEKMKEADTAWKNAQQSLKSLLGEVNYDQLYQLLDKIAEVLEYKG